jgi:multimeric flavodoxin WrbA
MKNETKNYRRILVHDLEQEDFEKQFPFLDEDTLVLSKEKSINHCIGCFGCWIKTPGTCVMKDDFQDLGKYANNEEELIVISKCVYGEYSPFVKNAVERCAMLSLLPFFEVRNNEAHHPQRKKHQFKMHVHFYGNDITDDEKKTAEKLVKANAVNIVATESEIYFYANSLEITGEVL